MKWYYWVGFIVAVLLGVLILIPTPVSKPSLLRYYAHYSFTPISTIILWIVAGIIYWLGRRGGK